MQQTLRNQSPRTEVFNVRLPIPLIRRIRERAKADRRTLTVVVQEAVEQYLQRPSDFREVE